jgi:hypothetical protein
LKKTVPQKRSVNARPRRAARLKGNTGALAEEDRTLFTKAIAQSTKDFKTGRYEP